MPKFNGNILNHYGNLHKPTLRYKKIALLIGLGTNLYVSLIGYISFAEIMLLFGIPVILVQLPSLYLDSYAKVTIGLMVVWLMSAILVDAYRSTPFELALRGWARVGLILLSFVVFHKILTTNPKLYAVYLIGFAISACVGLYVFKGGSILAKEEAGGYIDRNWTHYYNYAFSAIILAFSFLLSKKYHQFGIAVLVISGSINIIMGSRSTGGIMLVSAAIATMVKLGGSNSKTSSNEFKIASLLFVGLFSVNAVYFAYSTAAESGLLGEKAYLKYESQNVSDGGIILGGRTAVLAGALAVIDSPIIGYGSRAIDTGGFMIRAMAMTGMIPPQEVLSAQGARLPTHSHILEGWTEHGIAAGLFWLYFVYQLYRFGTVSIFVHKDYLLGNCLLLTTLCWSVCFSPVGSRVYTGAYIAYVIAMNRSAQRFSGRNG